MIFDIDGTISDSQHRAHHLLKKPKDWGSFNALMHLDGPQPLIIWLLNLIAVHYPVMLCTGREEQYRTITLSWLKSHAVRFDGLYMRTDKDYRPDTIIKRELLTKIRAAGYAPLFVVDDRSSVVEMWRAEGLVCLQCAPGNF